MDDDPVRRLLREEAARCEVRVDAEAGQFLAEVLARLGIAVPVQPALEALGPEQDQQHGGRPEQGDQ